jgi:hypothetical protein
MCDVTVGAQQLVSQQTDVEINVLQLAAISTILHRARCDMAAQAFSKDDR